MNEANLVQEVKLYKGLDVLAKSDGGEALLANLRERIATSVETLRSLLKGSEMDIRSTIAQLNADLYVYRTLLNAEQNAKISEEELEALLEKQKNEES